MMNRIKQTILAMILALGFSGLMLAPVASADCGGVKTSIINCSQTGGKNAPVEQTGVWGILLLVINILTAGVGVAAVGGILYASILYTTASGDVAQSKKAKMMIVQTVIGLAAFALMFAFLNFLIPGGLFT